MLAVTAAAYVGCTLWTIGVSFTSSHTLPVASFVGALQYARLFTNERWLESLGNLAIYGVAFIAASLLIGFLLAILVDRLSVAAGPLRLVLLYPYSMSFIATGLVWQWMLNPELGLQAMMRHLGFANFNFDWLENPDRVIYAIVIATVWQASGFVMILLLAGLRGIDADIWRAARVDGIPTWRVYVSIVLPMLAYPLATAAMLLLTAAVKLYDAVIAMTQGGPGTASEVPAKFIMDNLFGRANLGLASAASVALLLSVAILLAPLAYARRRMTRGIG
jgi:glucose/mannose transport system permease protein